MLNWLTRYAPLTAELELDESGALRESVLDVGCGPYGLSIIAPEATFAGVEVLFGEPVAPGMVAIRYDPGRLPFKDRAFDTVISLDVLEHVPPSARGGFVAELARVCARRVFIACPSDEAVWAEHVLKQVYAAQGIPLPAWLDEHDEHGLPTAAEIAGYVSTVPGCIARPLTMPNGLLSALTVLGDVVPGLADHAAAEWAHNRAQWEALFTNAAFGDCYRKGWLIERATRQTALVGAADLRTSVWSATRCPSCGRPALALDGDGVRCGACGHAAGRDASNAVDLRAPLAAVPPPARVPSRPGDALVLSPERWSRPMDWLPVLSAYVVWAPTGREVTLYLDARGADVEAELLRSLIESVCTLLANNQEYASIGLMEDGVEPPPGAAPVTGALELVQRLGLEVPIFTDDPEEVVAHARWAKQIVDALQSDIDRAAFEAAPRPGLNHDSLVTVRIPTFGSADLLVERAIPSVLAGAHRNLELLVCSDGPQPHARAAVEAIEDPRVRYLELDERPSYPTRKESFWQVAGTYPVNRMLDEARGEVIAPLDHDDGFTHGHISRLLEGLMHGDFAFGQAMTEYPEGDWRLLGSAPLRYGEIVHATVMYSSRLRHMRYDPDAWLLDEPGDWNMWRRIQATGAAVRHLAEPVAVHFKERSSIGGEQRDPADVLADLATDVLGTPARELLTVSSRERGVRLT
jgi:SAM-dependent methyltransferase